MAPVSPQTQHLGQLGRAKLLLSHWYQVTRIDKILSIVAPSESNSPIPFLGTCAPESVIDLVNDVI